MVPDEKITGLLINGADANALCEAAVVAGGLDNVSCCVIEIK
jgi:protein phosphatase